MNKKIKIKLPDI